MEQPRVAAGGPCARILVQHDEILVAGAQRGDGILAAVQREPEAVLVEADRAVEPGHGEVHGAEPQRGGQDGAVGGLGRGHALQHGASQRREEKKSTSSAAHSSRSSPPATSGRWLKRRSPSTSITLPAAPALGSGVP